MSDENARPEDVRPDDVNPEQVGPKHHFDEEHLGLAGRSARSFIKSPLSPLFYVAMMLMGLMGLILTPRQEDPQISVPMVDIFVRYQGASADQVANLAIEPLQRIVSEIPGVKHVYSAAQRGQGIVTIEFDVGEQMGPSLVKVNDKLDSNMDKIPPGVSPPLVKAKGIDDVPVVNLTLWSKDTDGDGMPDVDDGQLRMLAHDVLQSLKELPNTGNSFVVGGRAEQVTVEVVPERLSGYKISLDQVANTIRTANAEQQAGGVESGDTHFTVMTGSFLKTVDDISRLVVGTYNNVPVYVHDVARVTQGPEDAKQLVAYYTGPAGPEDLNADGVPAVTIAIAKKEGTNGVTVANSIINRVNQLKGTRIPGNVEVSITRDYGQTANDKVNELIFKLFVATGFVFFLVLAFFRAFRPAIVVVLVVPVVLLMTVFSAWLTGYTIDRVSLFALIFSIGILVDDAIVVVENIYRRWLEEGITDTETAIDAVREVGNPTILATFTVIAALLPMGFVSGMMGPYMEPIPALGSVAMLISLFAAFVFTPYLAASGLFRPSMSYLEKAGHREHKEAQWLEGFFRKLLVPLIEHPGKRRLFRIGLWGAFFVACSFFYTKWVAVKMLPLDNKPEFSVVLDLPEGTALPVTANLAHLMAAKLREMPEVTAIQVYAGTARPFDFNGMVRHYYLRQEPWQGEIQIQLLHKTERDRTSHEIAVQAREDLQKLIKGTGARIAVVEMPPGPPVLQSVVAEVHGPLPEVRRQVARDLTEIFHQAESTVDVDNYLRDPYQYWRFNVDTEKSVRRGISVDAINRNLSMALGGMTLGDVKQRAGHEPINIVIQVPLAERSQIERLGDLPVQSMAGITVPLRELGRFEKVPEEDIIYHKDLRPVEYVVSEVGGELAAPVYAMFQIQDLLAEKNYTTPDGVALESYWLGPPENDDQSAYEWTGEWTVTYETFRDMGLAFMVALVLIYILVVWEFGNFRIPALIMAPIPLTLLGIIPMHAIMDAEFTATSMIGWIALAGIIVRNSILLVDFSIHEVQKGVSVAEAVIRSCKTRTRPILITALALVCGSSVIFTDPIFQGMAISLASGVMVSTVLTLIVIPLGCIKASKSLVEVAAATAPAGVTIPAEVIAEQPARPAGPRTPVWLVIWSKTIGALMMMFYLVRGIFLLLMQFVGKLKSRSKQKKAAAAVTPAAPPVSSTAGGTQGSPPIPNSGPAPTPTPTTAPPVPPAPAQASSVPAEAVPETGSQPAPVEAVAVEKRERIEQEDSAPSVKSKPQRRRVAVSKKAKTKPTAAKPSVPVDKRPAAKVDAKPVVLSEGDSREAAPKKQAAPVKKRIRTKPAVKMSASDSAPKATARSKVEPKAKVESKASETVKKVQDDDSKKSTPVKSSAARKKPARRGIRLKLDTGTQTRGLE